MEFTITMPIIVVAIAFVFIVLLIALLILLFLQLRKPGESMGDINTILQNLSQTVQQGQTQIAVLSEKVAHLEPVTQTISTTLSSELMKVQQNLASLQAHAKARQDIEQQTIESVKRLELIIAGTQTKGAAGENIVDMVFAKLPVEWQIRDFTVNGRVVEFGLRLPSNLILPIDSKWPATNLVEQIAIAENAEDRDRLKREIEKAITQKAKEVSKYVEPGVTTPFAIAVIPDAVYELSGGVQSGAFQLNVVLVSYSMFVPYLFLTIQTTVKTLQSVDLQKLDAYLQAIQNSINKLQEELDGRFARALTMLSNSRDEMRAQISKASGSITSLQISAPSSAPSLPEHVIETG